MLVCAANWIYKLWVVQLHIHWIYYFNKLNKFSEKCSIDIIVFACFKWIFRLELIAYEITFSSEQHQINHKNQLKFRKCIKYFPFENCCWAHSCNFKSQQNHTSISLKSYKVLLAHKLNIFCIRKYINSKKIESTLKRFNN